MTNLLVNSYFEYIAKAIFYVLYSVIISVVLNNFTNVTILFCCILVVYIFFFFGMDVHRMKRILL